MVSTIAVNVVELPKGHDADPVRFNSDCNSSIILLPCADVQLQLSQSLSAVNVSIKHSPTGS